MDIWHALLARLFTEKNLGSLGDLSRCPGTVSCFVKQLCAIHCTPHPVDFFVADQPDLRWGYHLDLDIPRRLKDWELPVPMTGCREVLKFILGGLSSEMKANAGQKPALKRFFLRTARLKELGQGCQWLNNAEILSAENKARTAFEKWLAKRNAADKACAGWVPENVLKVSVQKIFGADNITSVVAFASRKFGRQRVPGERLPRINADIEQILQHPDFPAFMEKEMPANFEFAKVLLLNSVFRKRIEAAALSSEF